MERCKYRTFNSYRSAIVSTYAHVDGNSIGQHPLVSRLMKGAFYEWPPLSCYVGTWDVDTVLTHLKRLDLYINDLSLIALTLRMVMLMALAQRSRSADLSKLDLVGLGAHQKGLRSYPQGWLNSPTLTRRISGCAPCTPYPFMCREWGKVWKGTPSYSLPQ